MFCLKTLQKVHERKKVYKPESSTSSLRPSEPIGKNRGFKLPQGSLSRPLSFLFLILVGSRNASHRESLKSGEITPNFAVRQAFQVLTDAIESGLLVFVPNQILLTHTLRYVDYQRFTLLLVFDSTCVCNHILNNPPIIAHTNGRGITSESLFHLVFDRTMVLQATDLILYVLFFDSFASCQSRFSPGKFIHSENGENVAVFQRRHLIIIVRKRREVSLASNEINHRGIVVAITILPHTTFVCTEGRTFVLALLDGEEVLIKYL